MPALFSMRSSRRFPHIGAGVMQCGAVLFRHDNLFSFHRRRQQEQAGHLLGLSEFSQHLAEQGAVHRGHADRLDAIKEGYRTPGMKEELFELEDRKERLTKELSSAEEPPALLHPSMAEEYRKRIDRLFVALEDEQTRLEASGDIRSLVGRIVVEPGKNDRADLWLEGDLAGILTLAAGKKTPARPEDERVLLSAGAAIDNRREQRNEKSGPDGAASSSTSGVLPTMVAGACNVFCYNLGSVLPLPVGCDVENTHQIAA